VDWTRGRGGASVWIGCGAIGLTRTGCRAGGFRVPSAEPGAGRATSAAVDGSATAVSTPARDVDLYVQRSGQPNAYAAGGRSVAVTSRALEDYRAGPLAAEQMVAVLVHELGHHAARATQPMLLAVWLAAPWRMAARLLTGLAGVLSGRASPRAVRPVVLFGITVAVVRAVQQGHGMVGRVLGLSRCLLLFHPLPHAGSVLHAR
jgi:STE24 endopeptidase